MPGGSVLVPSCACRLDIVIACVEVTVVLRALETHFEQALGHIFRLEDDTAHDSLLVMLVLNQIELVLRILGHVDIA